MYSANDQVPDSFTQNNSSHIQHYLYLLITDHNKVSHNNFLQQSVFSLSIFFLKRKAKTFYLSEQATSKYNYMYMNTIQGKL